MKHFPIVLVLAMGAGLAFSQPALCGPPFGTDDPEPVDFEHFEINTALDGADIKGARGGDAPSIDFNYGLMPDTQFHVGLFAPFQAAAGQGTQIGYGDTEFGLKYRFIDEDEGEQHLQIAVYPNIDLPTGNAARGLGSGHTRIFLPIWLQESIGDWQTYGGGGYWLNQHGDDRNYWFMGWALLRKVSEDWMLGGEVFHQTADLNREPALTGDGISSHASTGFNAGGSYRLDDGHSILFSAGRGLQNVPSTNLFSYYLGYQLEF